MTYFEKRPYEWRDDFRSYRFMQTQGYKGKPEELFPSLEPIFNSEKDNKGLRGSALFQKMLKAKGGEKIPD